MAEHTIRIAMLNADLPVPNVLPHWSSYGRIFDDLLKRAASRISPSLHIQSIDYNIQLGEYPPNLLDVDVILITGSAASAYDDTEWIHELGDYIQDTYANHPCVKIFGSCFGHQLIGHKLLGKHGVKAEKDPNGHEVGVHQILFEEAFRVALQKAPRTALERLQHPTSITFPEKARLQFIHGDHVKVPSLDALPASWFNIGSTEHCVVQGLYEPGRVFTLQGHFEFDKFINTEVLKHFAQLGWPIAKKEYFEAVDADDDSILVTEMVLLFFLEDNVNAGSSS